MGTTPIYGFPYPDPSDLVANYPALGQDLAEDIEAVLPTIGGVVPATPTTIANSGGSASLSGNTVTFTGVSSVSLNGVFTSSFANYNILIHSTGSSGDALRLRLRVAGSDASGTNYSIQNIVGESTSLSGTRSTSQTSFQVMASVTTLSPTGVTIYGPFLATRTQLLSNGFDVTGGSRLFIFGGDHSLSTSYDGFTLFPASTTFTGTVQVYGYRN
jgi:hypothetical protein